MIHVLLSAVFCIPIMIIGLPWPCLFWPAAFYVGREVVQVEERYIETRSRKRSLRP